MPTRKSCRTAPLNALAAVVLLGALSACGGGGSEGSSGTAGASGSASDAVTVATVINCPSAGSLTVAQVLTAINQARSVARSCGSTAYAAAPAVGWSDVLATAASAHSVDMATNNYFDHSGSDGSTLATRVQAAGYSYSEVGENIAAGQTTLASVMAAWLASDGHCANLMNPNHRDVALACAARAGTSTSTTNYWTQVLGASR
jgi:uncharacterized protein YkwD